MRTRLLTTLAVILGSVSSFQAQASSDDSCYPRWSLIKENLEGCNNLPFLSPGNDSQVNLRLLLADKGALPLNPQPLQAVDLDSGYGPVPFPTYRLRPTDQPSAPESSTPENASLARLQAMGLALPEHSAGDDFLQGEGSRCRSNDAFGALDFIGQVLDSSDITDPERKTLAEARLQMLGACSWEPAQQASLIPASLPSPAAQAFATYLRAAADFYSGRFDEASQGFTALAGSSQPWLKETAAYMSARTLLNQAQQDAFDEYGQLTEEIADKALAQQAAQRLQAYLSAWPQGTYAASARGLLRRVYWLSGEDEQLATEYIWQLTQAREEQRNVDLDELVNEIDLKLLGAGTGILPDPMLMAVSDLLMMREQNQTRLSLDDLLAQKAVFDSQPALFDYLQAAHALYVQDDPAKALTLLPAAPAANLDYLGFSQQMLRGLALQARQDWKGAQQTWLAILPQANAPLQREQLELALAMSYERDEQLARVFASDSPIRSQQVRNILLSHVADAELLRQQTTQGMDEQERQLALFVLLYKDLLRSRYADFAEDFKRLPSPMAGENLGRALDYFYFNQQAPTLAMFQWQGDKAESGYACPTIAQTAAALQADSKDPKGLNCLGEFILRNRLDSMSLDQRRDADTLGGTAPGFTGEVYSRLDGYRQVIDNPKAGRDEKAYALFRAINCYAPSGYNSCGGQEVEPPVRKAWFRQLKTTYASTQWGQTLQYYW